MIGRQKQTVEAEAMLSPPVKSAATQIVGGRARNFSFMAGSNGQLL